MKLIHFLVRLAEDQNFLKDFLADPEAVMSQNGLKDQEKAALRSKDAANIRRALSLPAPPSGGTHVEIGLPAVLKFGNG